MRGAPRKDRSKRPRQALLRSHVRERRQRQSVLSPWLPGGLSGPGDERTAGEALRAEREDGRRKGKEAVHRALRDSGLPPGADESRARVAAGRGSRGGRRAQAGIPGAVGAVDGRRKQAGNLDGARKGDPALPRSGLGDGDHREAARHRARDRPKSRAEHPARAERSLEARGRPHCDRLSSRNLGNADAQDRPSP